MTNRHITALSWDYWHFTAPHCCYCCCCYC